MKADAIIFDKDGTLIDFDAFWVTVSVKALEDVLIQFGKEEIPICEILDSLGVHDGVTDIDWVLCKGTYKQMGTLVYDILHQYGCTVPCDEVTNAVIEAYKKNSDAGEIKATCPNLKEVLTLLKKRNKKLAVVTTDNEEITRKCLKELGIDELFDKIYTDDGKTPVKPDPYCVTDFCTIAGVKQERVVMVGDTITDVNFAKNAGISVVGVAKTDENKSVLSSFADTVISNLSELLDILE